MISDSIPKASSVAVASSNARDFAKKKRGNRSAKLKQCKLDARREQWLSQVKNKSGASEATNVGWEMNGNLGYLENERRLPLEKLELKLADHKLLHVTGSSDHHHHHFSDSESSPLNSPTSHSSSTMGSNDSGLHFSTSMRSSARSGRSSSSSSGFFSSEIGDYGDAAEDDCFDDWETMADALAAAEAKHHQEHHSSRFNGGEIVIGSQPGEITQPFPVKQGEESDAATKGRGNRHAWRPDDAFRPQSLPNLSKQQQQQQVEGYKNKTLWSSVSSSAAVPTSCPICCEDLDFTDSSFVPCLCGFRLCLFCHKRILEDDGRCPGCRKPYAAAN